MKYQKYILACTIYWTCLSSPQFALHAQQDNGLPASKADQFELIDRKGSYRTYKTPTGRIVSYDPETSEVALINGKYEAVIRENLAGDAANDENARFALDNGLPASKASQFGQIYDATTSSEWRKYVTPQGGTVAFNPRTSELWWNPVKENWEPVIRESSVSAAADKAKEEELRKRLEAEERKRKLESAKEAGKGLLSFFKKGTGMAVDGTGKLIKGTWAATNKTLNVTEDVLEEVLYGVAAGASSYYGSGGGGHSATPSYSAPAPTYTAPVRQPTTTYRSPTSLGPGGIGATTH